MLPHFIDQSYRGQASFFLIIIWISWPGNLAHWATWNLTNLIKLIFRTLWYDNLLMDKIFIWLELQVAQLECSSGRWNTVSNRSNLIWLKSIRLENFNLTFIRNLIIIEKICLKSEIITWKHMGPKSRPNGFSSFKIIIVMKRLSITRIIFNDVIELK